MSAMIAARFPDKVNSLVVTGAPIDADAGDGPIKRMAKTLPLSFFQELVALGGGLMKGKFMLQGWKNTFALWLAKSEVDDARDQLRTIYAQTLNCACKAATQ